MLTRTSCFEPGEAATNFPGYEAALQPPVRLGPLDEIHTRVKRLFLMLIALSSLILLAMLARLIQTRTYTYVDLGLLLLFAIATLSLTFAEMGCLRYIRQHARPHLVTLVLRDELTGLYNRRYMLDRIDEEIARGRRHRRPFAVVFLDLDKFKLVNDRWGHEAGDAVLKEVAQWLRANIRREDLVARVGGDEFLILLPDTSPSDATNLLLRLHTMFGRKSFTLPSGESVDFVTFSTGVSFFPDDGNDRESLLSLADRNMYAHKASK